MLDHGQDISLGAIEKVSCEESHATVTSAWERRNSDHAGPLRRGAGSMPAFFKISHTIDAETRTPSPASSPWLLR
jgi:hypothetical protein